MRTPVSLLYDYLVGQTDKIVHVDSTQECFNDYMPHGSQDHYDFIENVNELGPIINQILTNPKLIGAAIHTDFNGPNAKILNVRVTVNGSNTNIEEMKTTEQDRVKTAIFMHRFFIPRPMEINISNLTSYIPNRDNIHVGSLRRLQVIYRDEGDISHNGLQNITQDHSKVNKYGLPKIPQNSGNNVIRSTSPLRNLNSSGGFSPSEIYQIYLQSKSNSSIPQ